jgi:hypothetical protein
MQIDMERRNLIWSFILQYCWFCNMFIYSNNLDHKIIDQKINYSCRNVTFGQMLE